MKRAYFVAVFLALTLAFVGGAHVEAASQEPKVPMRVVSPSEFYYFDANGLRIPLALTRSIAVRFRTDKSAEEKQAYLQKYAPSKVRSITSVYPRAEFVLEYAPYIFLEQVAEKLKEMAQDPTIEVAPVFLVDGMEAIVDGVHLETTTPLSAETFRLWLENQFGKSVVHEITPNGSAWHVSLRGLFFLDSEKFPLHALSFANLLSTGGTSWIKRAYPKFVFLHAPVIASLSVTPASGTVGEERTVILRLRIFGEKGDVSIRDTDIPFFNRGTFKPLSSSAPPHVWFFEVRSSERRERVQIGPNEWLIEHRYVFGLYAPEKEWTISGVQIPYTYLGVRRVIDVPTVTLFVRLHLDERYQIEDMPYPPSIRMPTFPGFSEAEPAPEWRWFDYVASSVGGRGTFAAVLRFIFGASFFAGAVGAIVLVVRVMPQRGRDSGITRTELAHLLGEAHRAEDYKTALSLYQEAISKIFYAWNSAFPRQNLTYQFVKDRLKENGEDALIERLKQAGIERVFSTTETRHDASFVDAQTQEKFAYMRDSLESDIKAIQHVLMPNMR